MPRRRYLATKRAFDLGVCLIALPLLLPVFLLCWLAVRIDSPGPATFTQLRTGRHGKRFHMYKFRTMVQIAGPPQRPALARLQDHR